VVEIAPDARMGLVELSVSDLDRSLAYWQEAIGLRVLSRGNGTAELGTDGSYRRRCQTVWSCPPTAPSIPSSR
jgi:catechol 2,3-dioxygenase